MYQTCFRHQTAFVYDSVFRCLRRRVCYFRAAAPCCPTVPLSSSLESCSFSVVAQDADRAPAAAAAAVRHRRQRRRSVQPAPIAAAASFLFLFLSLFLRRPSPLVSHCPAVCCCVGVSVRAWRANAQRPVTQAGRFVAQRTAAGGDSSGGGQRADRGGVIRGRGGNGNAGCASVDERGSASGAPAAGGRHPGAGAVLTSALRCPIRSSCILFRLSAADVCKYICLNGGACVNGACVCPIGYVGADCAQREWITNTPPPDRGRRADAEWVIGSASCGAHSVHSTRLPFLVHPCSRRLRVQLQRSRLLRHELDARAVPLLPGFRGIRLRKQRQPGRRAL